MAFQALPDTHQSTRTSGSTRESTACRQGTALRVLLLDYEYPPLGGGAAIAAAALEHAR
jgi:hypothetical protein